jgi:hypothetical protein
MLVREWDPKTGELIGWLPVHSTVIRLTILEKTQPKFDVDQAVTIQWLPRPQVYPKTGQVLISPEPRVFEGERWLPVRRDSNVVRVARRLFLVQGIILGETKGESTGGVPPQFGFLPHRKNK